MKSEPVNSKIAREFNKLYACYSKNSVMNYLYENSRTHTVEITDNYRPFKPPNDKSTYTYTSLFSLGWVRVQQIHRILIASSNKGKTLDEVMRPVTYSIQSKIADIELYKKMKIDFPDIYRDLKSGTMNIRDRWVTETLIRGYYRNNKGGSK